MYASALLALLAFGGGRIHYTAERMMEEKRGFVATFSFFSWRLLRQYEYIRILLSMNE